MKACISCAKPMSSLREQDKCRSCWCKQYAQVCRPVARTFEDDDEVKPKRGAALREANERHVEVMKAKKPSIWVDRVCLQCKQPFRLKRCQLNKSKRGMYCTQECGFASRRGKKTKCA